MTPFFRPLLPFFLLLFITLSCTDHRLGGALSPTRSRLRSIEDLSLGTTTTYTYDSQNRPVSLSVSTGSTGSYTYDVVSGGVAELIYRNVTRQATTLTRFPYQVNGSSFTANTFGFPNQTFILGTEYTLDGNKQLTQAFTQQSGSVTNGTYVSQGNNVISSNVVQMRFRNRINYTYDAQINPFYGLVGPGLDEFDPGSSQTGTAEILRFSRNNPVQATNIDTGQTITYSYTYNSAGLPTTIQATVINKSYRFIYEPY